jgi:chemotaxis protein CheX
MHLIMARSETGIPPEPGEVSMEAEQIIIEIRKATDEVLRTMLGQEAAAGEAVSEQAAPGPTDGVVTLIGMAGNWIGTGSISCDGATACRLSSLFLMTEYTSVNEDVLDAMAELTNMIIGNFKTAVEEKLGAMGLSIPTVIFGRNFTTRSVSRNEWIRVPFTFGESRFDVHVCLAPGEKRPSRPVRPGYTELHSVGY